jgi:hypothetical protein
MADYIITQSGTWPTETYSIVPSSYNTVVLAKSALPTENLFRFFYNPANDIDKLTDYYTGNINYSYGNSNLFVDPLNSLKKITSNTSNNTFVWTPSAIRYYNAGPIFNYFKSNFSNRGQETGSTQPLSSLGFDYRSYLLFPQRLFLIPVSAKANNDGTYTLVTSSIFLSASYSFVNSTTSYADIDVYAKYLNYINSKPQILPLRNTSSPATFNLLYSVSATKNVVNNPIINYSIFDPIKLNYVLENSNVTIRPDSTFIKYASYITDNFGKKSLIAQEYPDEKITYNIGFKSSFIQNLTLSSANFQTFQLIQSTLNTNLQLEDINNAILTAVVNLSTNSFNYSSLYYLDDTNRPVSYLSGAPTKSLNFRYIADSPYYFNTSLGQVSTSVIASTGSNVAIPYNTQLSDSLSSPFDTITWKMNQPPHYHSYKVSFVSGSQFPTPSETSNLNFNLSSFIVNSTLSSITLSTCLISEFGFLTLDLPTYASSDLFAIKVIDYPQQNSFILSTINCFYGPLNNGLPSIAYDLINCPYTIPANYANTVTFVYPTTSFGETNLTVRYSLSSTTSNFTTDAPKANVLNFGKGTIQYNKGYPIFLKVLNQQENTISLDSSQLIVYPDWPARNLSTNTDYGSSTGTSNISWNFTCNSPYSSLISLQSIDSNGNFLSSLPLNSPIPFSPNTWTVNISGYGADTVKITLSSQKYNETASITTDPKLFDYFSIGKFVVGLSAGYINYGPTTKFALTAGIPYHGRVYPIPDNAPIYWMWNYDDNTSPFTQPITAYDIKNNAYQYGKNSFSNLASSLFINLALSSSKNNLTNHYANFSLKSNYNNTIGTYAVILQDYPPKNLFNVDFKTTYYGYSATTICDTRNGQNVITRPNTDINKFVFYTNTDVLPKIKASAFKWTISDNLSNTVTLSSTLYTDITSIRYNINQNASATSITLSALNATIAGYNIPFDISVTTTIYTLNTAIFYNPTKFIIYPPYTWQQTNSGYLTLLDQTNFTISQAPTAYGNKVSNSQNFFVSGNKLNDSYQYAYGWNRKNLTTTPITSSISSIEIPYSDASTLSAFYSTTGCLISVTSYNVYFPQINGVQYTGLNSNGLYLSSFKNTAQTIPFSKNTYNGILSTVKYHGITYNTYYGLDAFTQSPKLIPYDTVTLKYSAVDTAIVFDYNTITQYNVAITPVTSINLDNNVFVGVIQTISPLNSTSPVSSIQDFYNGSITYSISSKYWVENIDVPALNGIFELFHLNVGDATVPLTVSPYKFNNIVLTASGSFPVKITPNTFGLYPTSAYSSQYGDGNLWNTTTQPIPTQSTSLVVYSTSVRPEVYVSSYYTITGNEIYFQFKTPELAQETENISITSYNIYFGDSLSGFPISAFHLIGDTTYHTYSSKGVYTISYDVNYNNGESYNIILDKSPITVFQAWPVYDQSQIRLLDNQILTLPWKFDDISIQPNEYAVADIFNTSITRLHENSEYLKNNSQTINTDSPTLYYGWLGCNKNDIATGISWHTMDYNNSDGVNYNVYSHPEYATTDTTKNSFTSIQDISDSGEHLYIIDNGNIRVLSAGRLSQEITFDNISSISDLLKTPVSIDVDPIKNNLYLADSIANKIYKFNFSYDYINEINVQLSVGNIGGRSDANKFNSPQEVLFKNNHVYVLDYKNLCVKQYTEDLNWVYTYYTDDFSLNSSVNALSGIYYNRPENITIHPTTSFVYILTNNLKIYVFDYMAGLLKTITLHEAIGLNLKPIKITFDEAGEFLYLITTSLILKYTALGIFISFVQIPNSNLLTYTSGKSTNYRSLIISCNNSILKIQDITNLFKIGQGLPYEYWSLDQILVNREEFTQDISYNRALTRLIQNIKTFRNTMDSRFVLITEKTSYGNTVEYFAKSPITVQDRPTFSDDIENENVLVGVNEFQLPQVFNREFTKIYEAQNVLASNLSITDNRLLSSINTGCSDPFCWSWNAMSCYNLTLPVIRICNTNPITYAELESSFPSTYSYAPSGSNWANATAICCSNVVPPV